MRPDNFHSKGVLWGLALIGVAIILFVYLWQTPSWVHGKLTRSEIDAYLIDAEKHLLLSESEKVELLGRLRLWAEADDGRPFYMLNLMRHREQAENQPSAEEINARYEARALPILLKRGAYPSVAGETQGSNLLTFDADLDHWSRAAIVRYPSRRAFIEHMLDPEFIELLPAKLMAMQVLLVPVASDVVINDPRWLAGSVLLALFLAIGWRRTAIHLRTQLLNANAGVA